MAIVCLGALAVCPAGRAAVAEITVTLSPVADAEVRSASPDTNLGLLATATVSPEGVPPGAMPAYVYLRFDLSGLPSEAQVQEATLTMQAFSGYAWGGDGTVYVHFVAGDGWPEAGITWNTRPAQSATILGSWWLWYDFPDADQLGATSTPALAAAVQAQADGDNLLSVMLRSPGYMTEYRTREYGVVAQRPKLTLRIRTAADGVGRVPDGTTGLPLRLTKLEPGGGAVLLDWGASCGAAATDYAVYEGDIGVWYSHVPVVCSTSGALEALVVTPPPKNDYYLVAPRTASAEGSYGTSSGGAEIPRGASPCLASQELPSCP